MIIGCDFHPRFQQIAFLNQETGEYGERRLRIEAKPRVLPQAGWTAGADRHGSYGQLPLVPPTGRPRPERPNFQYFAGVLCSGCRPAKALAVLPGMSESGPDALPLDLALELGEHGQ